ncbi:hypothetical protein [Chryseolinea soli]|uniref:hypothetical protein n=1 Tax=Chryseolinea soli TaxID=2321403 RepID=UPI00135C3836|nr:hypothetical protein [Chryseolinea soli]
MSKGEKIVLLALAGLLTILAGYVAVKLGTSDAAFSILPGWHTTIYPPAVTWAILVIVILVASFVVYLIFRGAVRLLTLLWAKLRSKVYH